VNLKLEPGRYDVSWFSAVTGERVPAAQAEGPLWKSPKAPGSLDWALLLKKVSR
jgi:hypothetical protein